MIKEDCKAVFIGKETIWIGNVREKGSVVSVRVPNKFLPVFSRFRPLLSNVKDHMKVFQEKILISLNEGRTDERVRVYSIDLDTFEKNHADFNGRLLRDYEGLVAERNFLYGMVKKLEDLLKTQGLDDLLKTRFKDDYTFFTGLRPGFLYNKDDKKKEGVKKK